VKQANETAPRVPVWSCDICGTLVDITNGRIDKIDHCLDEHRTELTAGEWIVLTGQRES
jgi:hypothetical protein